MEKDNVKKLITQLDGDDNLNSNKPENRVVNNSIPVSQPIQSNSFQKLQSAVDPDLVVDSEIVELPSEGKFYSDGLKILNIEYLTAIDEDVLTTASLIQNGTLFDVIFERKIKTKGVDHRNLLSGDKEAITLFLRTSSYGLDYNVLVTNPLNGTTFKSVVDLSKLKYKVIPVEPDEFGYFSVILPMSKKTVRFRLITSGEEVIINKTAESRQEAYGSKFSTYNSDKLKASIIDIDGNSDRSYINKFVDAMRAGDSSFLRHKIVEYSPGVDMTYEFTTPEGHKFKSQLTVGSDFFFPSI